MDSVFDELTSRIDYHSLYSEYLRLHKKGNRFFALCPFHKEKTPSFHINMQNGLWHCFGCGEGGNVFQFIERMENLEMREVVELLAHRYGVDLAKYRKRGEKQIYTRRQYLLKVVAGSTKFYQNELFNTTHGAKALDYLTGRGLTEATIKRYRLGVTPAQADGLTMFLLGKNVKRAMLEELHLTMPGRGGAAEPIDVFRNRIIFPLFNRRGEVVSFAGRTLTDEEPKYLNTRNTPLYVKSRLLYGLNFARKAIAEAGAVYIVEGYMDVIALQQAGIMNVVATCGTALTADHIRELARYTEGFYLAFDGDAAGINAALRASEGILAGGHYPKILLFPKNIDPADVATQNGKEGLEKLRQKAVSYPRLVAGVRLRTKSPEPAELKKLFAELGPTFRRIDEPVTAAAFARDLAEVLSLSEKQVRDIMKSGQRMRGEPRDAAGRDRLAQMLSHPREGLYARFFAQLINTPGRIEEVRSSDLSSEDFPSGTFRELYQALVVQQRSPEDAGFPLKLVSAASRLAQLDETCAGESGAVPSEFPLASYVTKIRRFRLEAVTEKLHIMHEELARASEANDTARREQIMLRIQELVAHKKKLAAELAAAKEKTKSRSAPLARPENDARKSSDLGLR